MGIFKSLLGGILGGGKVQSGPSIEEIQRQQEKAAAKERARLEAEQAAKEAEQQKKAESALLDQEKKRAAFAGQLQAGVGEDDEGRKKFLKGI